MTTTWASTGARIEKPAPREPLPIRPTDDVYGRRIAWASPAGLVRDLWGFRGPVQGRELNHEASPHGWFVLVLTDVAWRKWVDHGISPSAYVDGYGAAKWVALDTAWFD